ncbi:MAG: hypothetical protein HY699_20470 [Deltaproteobacteria bacterium]|nr:hypothetical protein [Deltaproteobacteria bacterium]
MKTRHQLLGMLVMAAGLMFLSACGDDNDNGGGPVPPTSTQAPVNTATRTATVAPPTATRTSVPTATNTVPTVIQATATPTDTPPDGTPIDTATPTATPTATNTIGDGGACGDGTPQGDETCDDGNTLGGDGCASNCTTETAMPIEFDPAKSKATLQTAAFSLPLNLSGSQVYQLGGERASAGDGKRPIVGKAADVRFNPVKVTGLVCACVRGKEVPDFGPGISSQGEVGCNGLEGIDVDYDMDHSIGDDDPTCATGTADTNTLHPGVCNGKPVIARSETGGPGSALIYNSTAIGQISDGGSCATETRTKVCSEGSNPGTNCTSSASACKGGGTCVPAKGPNGVPCDDDDPAVAQGIANTLLTTTGTARASITDANNEVEAYIGKGGDCGGVPCIAEISGTPFNCANLPAASGSASVAAYSSLDAAQIQDNVVTSIFTAK